MSTKSQLDGLTVEMLRDKCREYGLSNYSALLKDALVDLVYKHELELSKSKVAAHAATSSANKNTNFFVKNINGTSDPRYSRANWLEQYCARTGSRARLCARNGCPRDAQVGAHVQIKDGRMSAEWYIVPLCSVCNSASNTEVMEINANIKLMNVTDVP